MIIIWTYKAVFDGNLWKENCSEKIRKISITSGGATKSKQYGVCEIMFKCSNTLSFVANSVMNVVVTLKEKLCEQYLSLVKFACHWSYSRLDGFRSAPCKDICVCIELNKRYLKRKLHQLSRQQRGSNRWWDRP